MPTIHLFGNPDLPEDSLAPRLLPTLEARFPHFQFRITDPNELDLPAPGDDLIAIDVVAGLKSVRAITPEEISAAETRATTHDFDFTSYLLLVKKLRPKTEILIFGLPMGINKEEAILGLSPLLQQISTRSL